MPTIHNLSILKERRRELRTHGTLEESILWNHLKNKLSGFKFRRQHSIGNFIVDFFCSAKRLIIELDGHKHKERDASAYDKERTAYLNERGYTVMRFWNNEIEENLESILSKINSALDY